jgi:hypothetical protein
VLLLQSPLLSVPLRAPRARGGGHRRRKKTGTFENQSDSLQVNRMEIYIE